MRSKCLVLFETVSFTPVNRNPISGGYITHDHYFPDERLIFQHCRTLLLKLKLPCTPPREIFQNNQNGAFRGLQIYCFGTPPKMKDICSFHVLPHMKASKTIEMKHFVVYRYTVLKHPPESLQPLLKGNRPQKNESNHTNIKHFVKSSCFTTF